MTRGTLFTLLFATTVACGSGDADLGGGPIGGEGTGSASQAVAIAAGYLHTCAAVASGRVLCWGENTLIDDFGDNKLPTPTVLTGVDGAVTLASDAFPTCALDRGGRATCWGDHGSSPSVVTDETFTSIAAGMYHTCGARPDGQVVCWGANDVGQLGRGNVSGGQLDKLPSGTVQGLSDVVSVISAGGRTCATRKDASIACWGDQAGPSPVSVDGVQAISVGIGTPDCAVTTTRRVVCWLWSGNKPDPTSIAPFDVADVKLLRTRGTNRCAVSGSGGLWCAGRNDHGQLGTGDTKDRDVPAQVTLPEPVTDVALGEFFTCALLASGTVMCWGNGEGGELGDGRRVSSLEAVRVVL